MTELINIFCPCVILSAVSCYWHILLIVMVVLHNERILRDKRDLFNVVFVLAFLCLFAVYTGLAKKIAPLDKVP